jgi:hypothetical protein
VRKPASRPDVRKAPGASPVAPLAAWVAQHRQWVYIGGGAAGALLILIVVGLLVSRGGAAPTGNFRVPPKGWSSPGSPAPALKKIQSAGGYGNCVFSSKQIDPGREDDGAIRSAFSHSEPIYGRCYFAHQIGPNKSGEVWQELWIDGAKRAQIIYDPALPNDQDQIAFEVSRQHGSRLRDLTSGKHTLDIWIYRQPEDAENPEPLAAGELVVRR